jgi:hypothetical protein
VRKKLVKICIGWPVVMVVLSLGLFGRYRFFWSRVEIGFSHPACNPDPFFSGSWRRSKEEAKRKERKNQGNLDSRPEKTIPTEQPKRQNNHHSSPTTRKERIRIAGRVGKASVLRLADPHHPQTTGLVQLCFYLLRKGKGKG